MNTQTNVLYDLLRSDGSVVMNKALVHEIGVHEAIIFSELLSKHNYYQQRGMLTDEGYFFCTQIDLTASTGIYEKSQRSCIKKLVSLGMIKKVNRGLPSKRYFKITVSDNQLINIIKSGKEKAENLYKSSVASIEVSCSIPSKYSYTSKGSTNNTLNNTENNTKLTPSFHDADYEKIFMDTFKDYFGYEHRNIKTRIPIELEHDDEDLKDIIVTFFAEYGCDDIKRNREKCSANNFVEHYERYKRE